MPRYFLDPPDGHAYGFPKLFEGDIDALEFDTWLRENGYPDDLIQMFPRGMYGKNGADIRLATDIIEDLERGPHITTVVLIGGDSDYIAVAQKVKQRGKRIVGIGARESSNQFWVKSCNEFKFYGSLLVRSSSGTSPESDLDEDLDDAKDLLVKAITSLAAQSGGNSVLKGSLKPMMVRLDPSFDVANFNFQSFSDFLEACSDIVSVVPGEADHLVSLRKPDHQARSPGHENKALPRLSSALHPYESLFRSQSIKLADPGTLRLAANDTFAVFQSSPRLASFQEWKTFVANAFGAREQALPEVEMNRLKALFYKAKVFVMHHDDGGISLNPAISSGAALLEQIHVTLLHRILSGMNGHPLDRTYMKDRICGSETTDEELDRLLELAKVKCGAGPVDSREPEPGMESGGPVPS